MLNLRDSFGKTLPTEWNTQYDITVFKAGMAFDVNVDTTITLLYQKRETRHVTPMEFNNVSGQLTFNKGSLNLPLGLYVFDIQATNVHGTKFYPSLGRINVVDPTIDDMFTLEDKTNNAFSLTGAVTPMKALKVTLTKVSGQGDRPTFENYTRFHPIQYTDTAMICDFEVPPFPLAQYIDANGTNWNHLIYYRIPQQFIVIDGLTPHQYTSNVRIAFDIKLDGTCIVEFKMTDATRTP